jgi:hypothetical protein
MSHHRPGRPAKPPSKRRQQLHISLYSDDIERLDQLTDNRSEFIRQCIARAWSERHEGEIALTVTVPKWLLHGMLKTASQRLPPDHVRAFRTLIEQIMDDGEVVEVNGRHAPERALEDRARRSPVTNGRAG